MTFELAAILLAATNALSFLLWLWGTLFVFWGAAKAARRMFWTEAEPWKGPQVARLEDVRTAFGHRLLLGLEFFIAGDIIRLLVNASMEDVVRLGLLALILVLVGFFVTREARAQVVNLKVRGARPRV